MLGNRNTNLLDNRGRPSPMAWAVLVVGAMAAAAAADRYLAAADENAQLADRVTHLEARVDLANDGDRKRAAGPQPAAAKRPPADSFPWDVALGETEQAVNDRIALLSLDTDAVAARSRIAAEARGIDDALALVARLRASPAVREAFLLSHETRKDAPVPVIAFTMEVDWQSH